MPINSIRDPRALQILHQALGEAMRPVGEIAAYYDILAKQYEKVHGEPINSHAAAARFAESLEGFFRSGRSWTVGSTKINQGQPIHDDFETYLLRNRDMDSLTADPRLHLVRVFQAVRESLTRFANGGSARWHQIAQAFGLSKREQLTGFENHLVGDLGRIQKAVKQEKVVDEHLEVLGDLVYTLSRPVEATLLNYLLIDAVEWEDDTPSFKSIEFIKYVLDVYRDLKNPALWLDSKKAAARIGEHWLKSHVPKYLEGAQLEIMYIVHQVLLKMAQYFEEKQPGVVTEFIGEMQEAESEYNNLADNKAGLRQSAIEELIARTLPDYVFADEVDPEKGSGSSSSGTNGAATPSGSAPIPFTPPAGTSAHSGSGGGKILSFYRGPAPCHRAPVWEPGLNATMMGSQMMMGRGFYPTMVPPPMFSAAMVMPVLAI